MRIEPLRELREEDARRLIVGYHSEQRYRVTKDESPSGTTISLELVDEPFDKVFPLPSRMIEWYGGVVQEGLSFQAIEEGEMIGLTIAQPQWNGVAMVWELHVSERHRRRGIGRALLDTVEAEATKRTIRAISIETQSSNVPAITFYRACGYQIGALDLSFYNNDDVSRGEVVVFMRKALS